MSESPSGTLSGRALWNPPPPSPSATSDAADEEKDETGIGDTVFTKSWVLSVLVRAVETVSKTAAVSKAPTCGGVECVRSGVGEIAGEGPGGCEGVIREKGECVSCGDEGTTELDESLEGDLCHLWDASMNSEVALFLHKHNAVDLLLGIARSSSSLRLTEICIGLVGNMACQEKVSCEALSTNRSRASALSLLCVSDSRILYETIRLVATCVSSCGRETRERWLMDIRSSDDIRESLKFIMKSSTNDDLLSSAGSLVDALLVSDDALLNEWSSKELVECVCHAIEQTTTSCSLEAAGTYIQCLHSLTTAERGVAALVECTERVAAVALNFIKSLRSSSESYLETSHTPLHASLSLLLSLKQNSSSSSSSILPSSGEMILQTISKELEPRIETECGTHTLTLVSDILSSLITKH